MKREALDFVHYKKTKQIKKLALPTSDSKEERREDLLKEIEMIKILEII